MISDDRTCTQQIQRGHTNNVDPWGAQVRRNKATEKNRKKRWGREWIHEATA